MTTSTITPRRKEDPQHMLRELITMKSNILGRNNENRISISFYAYNENRIIFLENDENLAEKKTGHA